MAGGFSMFDGITYVPNIQHSPEPTTTALADGLKGTGLSRISSKRTLVEIEV